MEEYNSEPVSITYKQKGTEAVKTNVIFKKGANFPSTKSVTFDNKMGGYDLMIHYAEESELMEGIPKQISQYDISEGKMQERSEKCSFTMRITNNIHNIACLDEAEFVEEWTQEDKIPIKTAPKSTVTPPAEEKKEGDVPTVAAPEQPEEQQYEIRQRKKKDFSKLKFNMQNFSMPPETRVMYKTLEESLVQGDSDILEQKSLRNTLEAYSYEMRNNLDAYGSWEKYLDEETRKTFLADLNQTIDWIYGDGENAPLSEYRTKLESYKKIGEPVKARYFYYSELEVYYGQFDKVQGTINDKFDVIEMSDANRDTISKKLKAAQSLMAGVKADKTAK